MDRTSSVSHNRYTAKAYDRISAFVPKGMRQGFRAECERRGVSMNSVIRTAIEQFLKDGEDSD